jgi:acetyltransferase-like isoleucine patch superfamily enzyme
MRSFLFEMVNAVHGWLVMLQRGRVTVGPGSRVRWLGMNVRHGGCIQIGGDCIVRCRIDFDSPAGNVRIGQRCYLGASHLVCHSGITLGDDVIMSWGVTVVDHDSHSLDWEHRQHDVSDWMKGAKCWDKVAISPVHIADKVWIGFGVSILKGVTVGEGAVIGANAVVTRDVPPYTVVAGNPARVVRRLIKG